jgi:hypothetical protein
VAFRPFSLDIFDKLAAACAEVRNRLEAELEALEEEAAELPELPEGTKAKALLDNLTALTKPDEVRELATLSDAEEHRLKELKEQEHDLRASDPKKRSDELTLKAQRMDRVATHVAKVAAGFGDNATRDLVASMDALTAAQKALAALRKTALTSDLLKGTGEQAWCELWVAAEAFSTVAYPGLPFPPTAKDARCPFCQQDLGRDARTRLRHLQEYVESSAQAEVRAAQSALEITLKTTVGLAIEPESITLTIDELKAHNPTLAERTIDFLKSAAHFQDDVKKAAKAGKAFPKGAVSGPPHKELEAVVNALKSRAASLAKQGASMGPADRAEMAELEARVLLRSKLETVLDEIERKKRVAVYSQCLGETATQSVTRKSTELTTQLVTDQLQAGFKAELAKLRFTDLAVEIRAAGGAKGALLHHLVLTHAPGVSVATVLSEGESRALSLASFLTELGTAASRSAIIFDDPVSSLDHIWRERIAARLVAEATTRQVIVFTHDLLFLRHLIDEAERNSLPYEHQYVRQEGHQAGIASADLPWVAMNTNKRIGMMRKRWQAAEKLHRLGQPQEYEEEARDIYGLLRETWEQAVGEVLLNDVVGRYRPAVETKKVRDLHDITKEDCAAVDKGVTECSRWLRGHDQAPADGAPFPSPKDLKERIDELDEFVQRVRKRR